MIEIDSYPTLRSFHIRDSSEIISDAVKLRAWLPKETTQTSENIERLIRDSYAAFKYKYNVKNEDDFCTMVFIATLNTEKKELNIAINGIKYSDLLKFEADKEK